MRELYRYSLRGRSLTIPGRVIRMTVTAGSADEARQMAQIRNPDFGTTVPPGPKRGARVEALEDNLRCRFCHRYVVDGLYQRVSFPDGVSNVCDHCFDKAYEADDYATWRDTEVEVA